MRIPMVNGLMRAFSCAFVVVGGLAGCAASVPSSEKLAPKPTVPRDPAWGVTLASQAELEHDRDCGRGALQTGFALVAFRDGRFDDKAIQTAMLDNLPNEKIRALRKVAYDEWVRTHEPASVALRQFDACLADNGSRLDASEAWLRCFFATEPATLMSIYRRAGRPISAAVEAVTPYYPISVDPSTIALLAKQAYSLGPAEELPFREQMFYECLATPK
jgi:hypothetical protein